MNDAAACTAPASGRRAESRGTRVQVGNRRDRTLHGIWSSATRPNLNTGRRWQSTMLVDYICSELPFRLSDRTVSSPCRSSTRRREPSSRTARSRTSTSRQSAVADSRRIARAECARALQPGPLRGRRRARARTQASPQRREEARHRPDRIHHRADRVGAHARGRRQAGDRAGDGAARPASWSSACEASSRIRRSPSSTGRRPRARTSMPGESRSRSRPRVTRAP